MGGIYYIILDNYNLPRTDYYPAYAARGEAIVLMSFCPLVDKNIENINNQLKYVVIRSKKGSITTFELFFEGHSNIMIA